MHTTILGGNTDTMLAMLRLTQAGSCRQGWVRTENKREKKKITGGAVMS
jgi:hypothetical protein